MSEWSRSDRGRHDQGTEGSCDCESGGLQGRPATVIPRSGSAPADPDRQTIGVPDLNWGPLRPERSALPGCATPRAAKGYRLSGAAGCRSRSTVYSSPWRRGTRSSPSRTSCSRWRRPEYGPAGLQVVGADEVTPIACGVSRSRELFEQRPRCGRSSCSSTTASSGIEPLVVDARLRGRLEALFAGNVSLAAYHLALDAHPSSATTPCSRAARCRRRGRFDVGLGGTLARAGRSDALTARVRERLGREPLSFLTARPRSGVSRSCRGRAPARPVRAAHEGYDLLLTGEPAEPTMLTARELGIHFVAGGHYATERLGVQALAARIAEEFDITWDFVELTNPV